MSQDDIIGNATVIINNSDRTRASSPLLAIGTNELYLQTKDLSFGQPSQQKYLDRVIFDLESPGEVPQFYVQLGYRDSLGDPIEWLEEEQLTLPNPQIIPRVTAKFFTLRLDDRLPLSQWRLGRIEFYGQVMQGRL